MPAETIGSAYVQLALAIDQHMPGYVDAFFGPLEWQDRAKAAGPRPHAELARQASALAGAIADSGTLDTQRKEFLARQVVAMQASVRLLQGERMALADEAEALYDVRPTWVEESLFEAAQRVLHDLLPPGDTLAERMALRKQALAISSEQAQLVLPLIHQQLRNLSRARFPLPEDESISFAFVQNQPWMAYNWYLGGCRSRIEINTDLPLYVNELANLVAHEAYPGHHTELAIKERRLAGQAGRDELSLTLINAPSCVVSEGIATCALATVLSDEAWVAWHAEEIFPAVGLKRADAWREHMIDRALERLAGVYGNAAFLLHEHGAKVETVGSYLQRYGLLGEHEARKAIEFMSGPLDRAYIFTYDSGRQLLQALFAAKQERSYWFSRLLTEAVTPTHIRQWMHD